MAIIAGDQNNQQAGTNLTAGMNTGNQPQASQPAGGAVTTSGQTVSGQGGSGGQATSGNATAKAPANNFTNFGSFLQSNQQAGNRLNNLLTGNVNQQANEAQSNLSSGAQGIQNAVQSENQRISNSLQNLQGAVKQTGQNDYSGFNQFLNPNQSTAPNAGQQTGQNTPTTSPSNTNNPAYYGLQSPYQQLATGQTQQSALQQQANNLYNQAGVAQAGMQNTAAMAQNNAGVQQLLSGLLGQKGNYGTGAQALDQSLVTGNSAGYTNLLNNINQQNQAFNSNIANQTQGLNSSITGLGTTATQAQQQAQAAAQQGLGNLNTLLTGEASAANANAAQQQAAIANEFKTGQFDQATAQALGLQQGTTLFNVLQNNQPSQFYSNGATNTGANLINNQQLGAYSALQQMLGQSPGNFAYTQTGTGPQQAYNLNKQTFDTDLANAYQNAINSANSTNITGTGQSSNPLGGANSNINDTVNQIVNMKNLQAGQQYYQNLAQNPNQVPSASPNLGNVNGGLLNTLPTNFQTYAFGGNPFSPNAGTSPALTDAGTAAQNQAQSNFLQNWQNYQNVAGYNNVAQVAGGVAPTTVLPSITPALQRLMG